MAEIELTDDTLRVHMSRAEAVFTWRTSIAVAREHIRSVQHNPAAADGLLHGVRVAGVSVPGFVQAGTFMQNEDWTFWDVHAPDQAIELFLHDECYTQILVGVDDPAATVDRIQTWLNSTPAPSAASDASDGAADAPAGAG